MLTDTLGKQTASLLVQLRFREQPGDPCLEHRTPLSCGWGPVPSEPWEGVALLPGIPAVFSGTLWPFQLLLQETRVSATVFCLHFVLDLRNEAQNLHLSSFLPF